MHDFHFMRSLAAGTGTATASVAPQGSLQGSSARAVSTPRTG